MKRRSRIRVSFFDENHLVEKAGFRFSWWWFSLGCVFFSLLFVAVGMGIIWFSPLKQQLPGYMPTEQREDTELSVLELDSLETIYRINQAYIDNVAAILDGDISAEIETDTISSAVSLDLDSLVIPSRIEREFVKKLEGKGYVIGNHYNVTSNDSIK